MKKHFYVLTLAMTTDAANSTGKEIKTQIQSPTILTNAYLKVVSSKPDRQISGGVAKVSRQWREVARQRPRDSSSLLSTGQGRTGFPVKKMGMSGPAGAGQGRTLRRGTSCRTLRRTNQGSPRMDHVKRRG